VNDCPKGYPNLAAFLDSDDGFAIYRRFGYLQSRLLLNRQDELRALEVKLNRMERVMMKKDEDSLCTRNVAGADAQVHRDLLDKIETKFCSYGIAQKSLIVL
jgi:predicted phage tail protein